MISSIAVSVPLLNTVNLDPSRDFQRGGIHERAKTRLEKPKDLFESEKEKGVCPTNPILFRSPAQQVV